MSTKKLMSRVLHTVATAFVVAASWNAQAAPLNISQAPLFLNGSVPPLNMIVMGRDHKLYYEAYNDASDLNDDGVLDTKYKGFELKVPAPTEPGESIYKIDYFGYFDSYKCYTFNGTYFDPIATVGAGKTCSGNWSGDYLNYLTTARIDALRKVLYGGDRSTDTTTDTILERTYVPQDAHSWGKEYTSIAVDGYDIANYTPLSSPLAGTRHFFANTTPRGAAAAGAAVYTTAPVLRWMANVGSGRRVWNWVSKERPVAHNAGNCIDGLVGCPAIVDYIVRVKVCKTGYLEVNCKQYPNGNYKPTGLIQDYGEGASPRMYFGLMSGSYARNTSGGVLRRQMGSPTMPLSNEIDANSGQFLDVDGIVRTFNRLHATGFREHPNYDYTCGWITNGPIGEGTCQMWGNPIAEIMYESARYFAGRGAPTGAFTTTFGQGEEGQLPGGGMPVAAWNDPYGTGGHARCAKPFQTVISDINPTYDSDQLPGVDGNFGAGISNDLPGALDVSAIGQTIWNNEFGGSRNIFIGQSGASVNSGPTPKIATTFGNLRGLAPEDPTKQGSYYSASVAYHAHETDLNPVTGQQKLTTFAVALASPLPKIAIPVAGRTVTLVPFAKSVAGAGINSASNQFQPTNQIVDFYVDTITPTTGRFHVNFEDVEQGADHDMDAIVTYEYSVVGSTVSVRLTSDYAAGGIVQHMGYIISGTTSDGIYLEVRDRDTVNDTDYFLDTPAGVSPPAMPAEWQDLAGLPFDTTRTFTAGTTGGAELLRDPLWYAAKWGGFEDSDANGLPNLSTEWDENGDGKPDNYFLVTNALTLGAQLANAFDEIISRVGSASSASVNAGSISSTTRVYQAKFNSGDWTGSLLSFPVQSVDNPVTPENEIGQLLPQEWDAADQLPAFGSRQIVTINQNTGLAVPFRWGNIGAARQSQLAPTADGLGPQRLDYIRGDGARERLNGGMFRNRPRKLGDIVSSSPAFVGKPESDYSDTLQAVPYSSFVTANAAREGMVYVGSNDGMLHAFNASSGVERFAFIPGGVFTNLHELTKPSYNHMFFVDGSPTVGDIFNGSVWKTMLVAGLNRGGRSIYALDITNPSSLSEATATTAFRWEFTDTDLGYTYSRPQLVRMANGVWAAIFGNGYQPSTPTGTGRAYLYIVNAWTGALIRKIDTGVGNLTTPNGLATPAIVDLDGDGIVEYAYAGDLQGNLWKFRLTGATVGNWDVAFTSPSRQPLFVARDASNARQPITSRPEVGFGPNGNDLVVLFGTGKFLELVDKTPTQQQTFYGVFDANTGGVGDIVSGRAVMTRQEIIFQGNVTFTTPSATTVTRPLRVSTENAVGGATGRGWYLDLLTPPGTFNGEMQVSDSILRNGRVIFTTLIPDADPCSPGGTSWLMELDSTSGARLDESPFDNNRDSRFTDDDLVEVVLPDGTRIRVPASGLGSEVGITATPGVAVSPEAGAEFKYLSGTTANAAGSNIQIAVENPGRNAFGRQSWRQIR